MSYSANIDIDIKLLNIIFKIRLCKWYLWYISLHFKRTYISNLKVYFIPQFHKLVTTTYIQLSAVIKV